jgi:hypothetical protein
MREGCPLFLKKWVPTGAQVIIVKAQTLVNWQHEFAKTFNSDFVHPAKLVLVLDHGQLKPKDAYISNYAGRISNEETSDLLDWPRTMSSLLVAKTLWWLLLRLHICRIGKCLATRVKNFQHHGRSGQYRIGKTEIYGSEVPTLGAFSRM